jgi:hypothetical protein
MYFTCRCILKVQTQKKLRDLSIVSQQFNGCYLVCALYIVTTVPASIHHSILSLQFQVAVNRVGITCTVAHWPQGDQFSPAINTAARCKN